MTVSQGAGQGESWIERWWQGRAGAGGRLLWALTLPAELVFRAGVELRNRAYDRGTLPKVHPEIPTVSVGNLVVGGTGKTPVTGWIVDRLRDRGHRPAVVMRGYGQDEVELHRRWHPDVPVLSAPRKADGVREAVRRGRTVAVVDDGFQHRALERSLDFVLMAAEDPVPVRLLPRGPYREPLSSLRRADLVLVTSKGGADERRRALTDRLSRLKLPAPVVELRLRPGGWANLEGDPTPPPSGSLLAVAGVARPASVLALLEEEGYAEVEGFFFPDHHEYGRADVDRVVDRAGDRTVVTTEKDAVKLRHFGNRLAGARVLRLRVEVSAEGEAVLDRLLESLEGPGDGPRNDPGVRR